MTERLWRADGEHWTPWSVHTVHLTGERIYDLARADQRFDAQDYASLTSAFIAFECEPEQARWYYA